MNNYFQNFMRWTYGKNKEQQNMAENAVVGSDRCNQ